MSFRPHDRIGYHPFCISGHGVEQEDENSKTEMKIPPPDEWSWGVARLSWEYRLQGDVQARMVFGDMGGNLVEIETDVAVPTVLLRS